MLTCIAASSLGMPQPGGWLSKAKYDNLPSTLTAEPDRVVDTHIMGEYGVLNCRYK